MVVLPFLVDRFLALATNNYNTSQPTSHSWWNAKECLIRPGYNIKKVGLHSTIAHWWFSIAINTKISCPIHNSTSRCAFTVCQMDKSLLPRFATGLCHNHIKYLIRKPFLSPFPVRFGSMPKLWAILKWMAIPNPIANNPRKHLMMSYEDDFPFLNKYKMVKSGFVEKKTTINKIFPARKKPSQ